MYGSQNIASNGLCTQQFANPGGCGDNLALSMGDVRTKSSGGNIMNSDQLEGKWKQVKGEVREKWGKLTDDDIQIVAGRRDQLIGRVQERYGMAKEAATKEVDTFLKHLTDPGEDFTSSTPSPNDRPKVHSVGR
jgi:uncharacterized protein YjbJ (UPF0337 family)